ncbi:alkanesulfonate monooxygenase [Azotobacter beijerinckii]|uniref:Alkanesulfonate monooxygenase n=1 Tax=Azotobacter beijerinckii TaxID=170623 RepID=A0A1H6ZW89_9GAMM|nr:LLM class flavin-dependent oxidoreductase [Azotobacter beijerinckii]SEJ56454.1 alkanesulfonate monooxygenase [Azotobacter beijerinckii]
MSATHRVEFIGFLSHREASEARPGDGPLVDKAFLGTCARAQEHAGFDRALIAYHSTAPDGLQVAAQAAQETRRLGLLVAHRPGVIAPTVAARQFATFDHFSDGRAAINIISGGDAAEQRRDGDFLDHDERYARTDEYLDVLKHAWRSREPFDFEGRYYRVKEHFALVQPLQAHLPIYFSGSSPAALKVAGRHADVFMMWGEPLAGIAEQIAAVRAAAARHGRAGAVRFSLSVRPILGATEAEAWTRAERVRDAVRTRLGSARPAGGMPQNTGSQRLLEFAARGEVLDSCLWTGITALTGASSGAAASTGIGGNSTALVGTPEQVADALVAYHRLGVDTFLVRGFDLLADALQYGSELLPRVRGKIPASIPAAALAPF